MSFLVVNLYLLVSEATYNVYITWTIPKRTEQKVIYKKEKMAKRSPNKEKGKKQDRIKVQQLNAYT
jgi:hypothetical protein